MSAQGKKKQRQEPDQELVKDSFVIVMRGKLYMKVETTTQKSTKTNEPKSGFLCEKPKYYWL